MMVGGIVFGTFAVKEILRTDRSAASNGVGRYNVGIAPANGNNVLSCQIRPSAT